MKKSKQYIVTRGELLDGEVPQVFSKTLGGETPVLVTGFAVTVFDDYQKARNAIKKTQHFFKDRDYEYNIRPLIPPSQLED